MKTTIQILNDKGLFEIYANADRVLRVLLFVTRRKGDSEKRKYLKTFNDFDQK